MKFTFNLQSVKMISQINGCEFVLLFLVLCGSKVNIFEFLGCWLDKMSDHLGLFENVTAIFHYFLTFSLEHYTEITARLTQIEIDASIFEFVVRSHWKMTKLSAPST